MNSSREVRVARHCLFLFKLLIKVHVFFFVIRNSFVHDGRQTMFSYSNHPNRILYGCPPVLKERNLCQVINVYRHQSVVKPYRRCHQAVSVAFRSRSLHDKTFNFREIPGHSVLSSLRKTYALNLTLQHGSKAMLFQDFARQ